jgi:type I site-specific restriction endonuclease
MVNRNTQQNGDRKMVLAIPKYLANAGTMTLAGKAYTPTDLGKLFQGRIDSIDAATAAHAKWLDAVKADRDQIAQTAVVVRALKDLLRSMFATQAETLADFGLTPRKVTKKTVATLTQAVAQSQATRKARSTMGKVQKLDVTAPVNATVVVTPVGGTAPATPATAQNAAPAATAAPVPAPQGTAPAGGTSPHTP